MWTEFSFEGSWLGLSWLVGWSEALFVGFDVEGWP